MNNLSLLVYLAEIIPNLSIALALTAVATVILYLIKVFNVADNNNNVKNYSRIYPDLRAMQSPSMTPTIVMVVCFVLLAILLPSKSTIYLIAGSEAGETVVKSPEAQEIMNDIQTIIKQQIKSAIDD